MEWLLTAVAGGGVALAGRYLWARRVGRQADRAELDGVRRLADEDVTLLGEELRRLDAEVAAMGEDARADYQRALDAYESAEREVHRIRAPEQVSTITDTLSTGRYALACVRARVAGRPLPELRVPCFFNPQHGPSARDVVYTHPRRGTRKVPACARDAARVEAGEQPKIRTVAIGSRQVPYWEAGAAYLPYGAGYFAGGGTAAWAFDADVSAGAGGFGPGHGGAGDVGFGAHGGAAGGGGDVGPQ